MNILLTNDDGIECEGLLLLASALRKKSGYNVWIIAPDSNRSGVSHSISFSTPPLKLTDRGGHNWSCSGTPADCVMMAVLGFLPVKFDLIVSGINVGANMGTDIIYSGTAAAARQAALHGYAAVALSLEGKPPFYWEETAAFAAENIEQFAALWKPDTFINVNFPNIPDVKETVITYPSRRRYNDSLEIFKAKDGKQYCFVNFGDIITKPEHGSDEEAVTSNKVSASPVFIHPVVRRDLCDCAPSYAAVDPRPESHE